MFDRTHPVLLAALLLAAGGVACSGNNGAGSTPTDDTGTTVADMGTDEGSTTDPTDLGETSCCPEGPISPRGRTCEDECGPCDYGYDENGCGGETVECLGGEWIELVSVGNPACDGGDMGSDADPVDMGTDVADMVDEPDAPPQACFHPSTDPTCPMGEFGPGGLMDFVEVAAQGACCTDFDGDGDLDNQIGFYAALLASQGADINAQIADAISIGDLAYLLEFSDWSNAMNDPDLSATLYVGRDNDTDYTDNLAGTGQFEILPDSFDPNGDALWPFAQASVSNGVLKATGGSMELYFPGLLDQVRLKMSDVSITANVVPPADLQTAGTVTLADGELSGVLDRDVFFESLNEASTACVCLQKSVFTYVAADDKWDCVATQADETNCQFDPLSGCRLLSSRQGCGLLEQISEGADVDTDGDDVRDGYSLGARFTTVGASIVGRAPAP